MPCFSFYLLCIFFYKIEEKESRTGLPGEGGSVGGRIWWKQCIHICVNAKVIPAEWFQVSWEGE
jgi:hypothetical protein